MLNLCNQWATNCERQLHKGKTSTRGKLGESAFVAMDVEYTERVCTIQKCLTHIGAINLCVQDLLPSVADGDVERFLD